ncbi:MAG: hypothetical protein IPL86_11660 [Flavobacteriales bacterium]|nr:hypothetical protein [Flavobacteriales bacterium]
MASAYFALAACHFPDPEIGHRIGVLRLVGLLVPNLRLLYVAQCAVALSHLVDQFGLDACLLLDRVCLLVQFDRIEEKALAERIIGLIGQSALGHRRER